MAAAGIRRGELAAQNGSEGGDDRALNLGRSFCGDRAVGNKQLVLQLEDAEVELVVRL